MSHLSMVSLLCALLMIPAIFLVGSGAPAWRSTASAMANSTELFLWEKTFNKFTAALQIGPGMSNPDTGMINPAPLDTSMIDLENVGTAVQFFDFKNSYQVGLPTR